MPIAALTAGQIIDPTTFGNAVADQLNVIGGRWTRAAVQAVATAANTAITWDTELADTSAMITPPATTFTIPSLGVWDIAGVIVGSAIVTARHVVFVSVTSAVSGVTAAYAFNGYGNDTIAFGLSLPLAAGDTILVSVFQQSGSSVNYTGRVMINRGVAR